METEIKKKVCKCPECERREMEKSQSEELNFAILVALVPAMAITLFSTLGLF